MISTRGEGREEGKAKVWEWMTADGAHVVKVLQEGAHLTNLKEVSTRGNFDLINLLKKIHP